MQTWALTVCITMIGSALFSMLVPNNSMQRVVKFTLNLFFITALLSPFITEFPDLDLSFTEQTLAASDELYNLMEEETINHAERTLEEGLTVVFEQNGYKIEDIAININIEEETSEIVVVIPKEEQGQIPQIEQLVKNETGILPSIVCQ